MTWGMVGGAALGVGASLYSGRKQAKAAEKAANLQAESAQKAIEAESQARDVARQDLMPFTQFGAGNLPALQQFLTPEGQAGYLNENNPLFRAALANLNTQTAQQAAIRGRVGAGDTRQNYLQNWQAAALPLLQNQQNALFNAVNLGQSSAAGQANTALTSSGRISDLTTGAGAAQASGVVGAANAKAAGLQGAAQAIGTAFGGMGTADSTSGITGWGKLFGVNSSSTPKK